VTAVAAYTPAEVGNRALVLQRKRQAARIVLPDLARKTGYTITDLLRMDTGEVEVSAADFDRICEAIEQLEREKFRR
jgi:predicted transcriptional regulator